MTMTTSQSAPSVGNEQQQQQQQQPKKEKHLVHWFRKGFYKIHFNISF